MNVLKIEKDDLKLEIFCVSINFHLYEKKTFNTFFSSRYLDQFSSFQI